jgi:hypothetical protein
VSTAKRETKFQEMQRRFKKELEIPCVVFSKTKNIDGTESMNWFTSSLSVRVWKETDFEGDFLTTLKSRHKETLFELFIYHHTYIGESEGWSSSTLEPENKVNGITITKGKLKAVSPEEASEKFNSGQCALYQLNGTRWEKQALREYVLA